MFKNLYFDGKPILTTNLNNLQTANCTLRKVLTKCLNMTLR